MDSSVMATSYATNDKLKYGAHIIELLSDKVTYDNNIGKFSLSYITVGMDSSTIYERTVPKTSTSNIVNSGDKLGTSNITKANYVELTIPKHLFYIENITIKPNTTRSGEGCLGSCNPQPVIVRHEYIKGQKFLVVNTGGSVDSPYIVGVV